jgi:HK97 family phage prohead protease
MLVYTRMLNADGEELLEHDWGKEELEEWFKNHTDEKGFVQQDIVLFAESEIKAADNTYEWVMSDYTLDRDGERIDPDGWDLKAFKKNPVLLWAHNHYKPAIGKVSSPRVKDGQLTGKVTFDSDNDEFARLIEGKVKGGILNTGSVGFRSIQVEMPDQKAKEEAWLIHRKQELFEFSICNVPSNPAASRRSVELKEVELETEPPRDFMRDYVDAINIDMAELEDRIERLEECEKARNIYSDIFKDRDETSPEEDHETSDLSKFFDIDELN